MIYLGEGSHSTGLGEADSDDLVLRRGDQGVGSPVVLEDVDVLRVGPGDQVAGTHVALQQQQVRQYLYRTLSQQ